MGLRDRIQSVWARVAGERNPAPADDTSSGEAYAVGKATPDQYATPSFDANNKDVYDWLQKELSTKLGRKKNLDLFAQMEEEFPEIASALDVYADNVTQVGLMEDKVVTIKTQDQKLKEVLEEVRDRIKLDERAWSTARTIARDGEVFEEVVVNGNLEIDRLKRLPTYRMLRNEDRFGILSPDKAFIEMKEDMEAVAATFQDWEVVHYRLQRHSEDRYGSSLLQSVRRVFKQLRLIEDGLALARLTRANSRLVYFVDVGNMPPTQAEEHLKRVRNDHRKRRMFDSRTGQLRDDANPMTVEEDIFIATRSGSPVDVKQLYGDINIGNIDDIHYFQDKLFGGLKVPKGYLGVEREINAKATLTTQDIQFARSVRRIQLAQRAGYKQVFDLALVLEGRIKDPRAIYDYQVLLPAMKTLDELREWEMKRIQGEVARIWIHEVFADPIFVYQHILGFSQEQAEKLYKGPASGALLNPILNPPPVAGGKGDGGTGNRAAAFRSGENKRFAQKAREAVETLSRERPDLMESLRALKEFSVWALEDLAGEEVG